MSSAASNLALIPVWQRGLAKSARIALQAKNLGTLPAFIRQHAMSVIPNTLRKKAEQQGIGLREYQELQCLGEIDAGDLNAVYKREAELGVQLDIAPHINEEKLAEAVAKAIERAMKDLIEKVEVKARMEAKRYVFGQQMQHASGYQDAQAPGEARQDIGGATGK